MGKSIYLELNGVIRDVVSKALQVYKIENPESELPDELESNDLVKEFNFSNKEELIDFLYVESPMRVFGYASEKVDGVSFMVNELYKKYRDKYTITIFSNEVEKSKPATLMFLARMGILIDNIKFYPLENFTSVWDDADIVISSNPEILNNKVKNKKSIKVIDKYNEDVTSDITIKSIKDIVENEYFEREQFT